jgi:hypothetical protein
MTQYKSTMQKIILFFKKNKRIIIAILVGNLIMFLMKIVFPNSIHF